MMNCEKCGQAVPTKIVIDALGREVACGNVILWLKPIRTLHASNVHITFDNPVSEFIRPVKLHIQEIEGDENEYILRCVHYGYGLPFKETIHGKSGETNHQIYKLAGGLGELL